MAFQKYNIANDAIGNLAVGIGASDTSISLSSGQGAKFTSSNSILTIVQYATADDPTSNVVKKESVVLTNRSSDSMTITRAFESSATDFNAGDWVYLANHTAVTKDIQDEVTRLESDKLNKGGLRTALTTAWRFFFSNGSSNETELAFGDAGKYLKSTGFSSTPVWDNPPLDINSQTTSTSPSSSWLVPLFDGANNFKTTLANLVKGLATATTSQAGVVEMATDTEATAGTDEIRCVNAKQVQISTVSNCSLVHGELSSTSTYNIAHGLGRIPKSVEINITFNNMVGFYSVISGNKGFYNNNGTITATSEYMVRGTSGGTSFYFKINSVDATNVNVTGTMSGGSYLFLLKIM